MANQPPTIALKDRLSALLLELLISIFSELSCRDIGRLRTTSRSIRTIIDTYIATIVRSRILFHQSRLWSNYETLSRNGSLLPSEVFERFLCYYGEMGGYTTDIRRDALVRIFERYVHTRHDHTEDQVPTSRCELVAQACADAAIWVLEVAASRRQEIGPWTSDFLAEESKKLYFWNQRVNADGRLRRCSILLKDGVFGGRHAGDYDPSPLAPTTRLDLSFRNGSRGAAFFISVPRSHPGAVRNVVKYPIRFLDTVVSCREFEYSKPGAQGLGIKADSPGEGSDPGADVRLARLNERWYSIHTQLK